MTDLVHLRLDGGVPSIATLDIIEALGPRYKSSPSNDRQIDILYRSGKASFHPSGAKLAEDENVLTWHIDVRIPKNSDNKDADALLIALETHGLSERGFERVSDETTPMTSKKGEESGYARSIAYQCSFSSAQEAAVRIRALVESLDSPLILGVHEPDDIVIKDPMRIRPAPATRKPLDLWTYKLSGGFLSALVLEIDPNIRSLRVIQRKFLSTKEVHPSLRLAHVAKFGLKVENDSVNLVAFKREGPPAVLASAKNCAAFAATAERMADKVLIPIEQS